MKKRIYINNDWNFTDNEGKMAKVSIPHTIKEIPYNYFDQEMFQFEATYEKEIMLTEDLDQNLFLTFEGVGQSAQVFLNNKFLLKHEGGYDKFSVNIKDYVNKGGNILKVIVNASENQNIPPFGKVVDYLCYGGIYRDVYIDVCASNYVEDVFVKPVHDNAWKALIDVKLKNAGTYDAEIYFDGKLVAKKNVVSKNYDTEVEFTFDKPMLWDIDNPNLYTAKINLLDNDKVIDTYETTFGLRTCVFKTDGFYLNDKKVRIIGLNRHQAYPYVGYAMPKSMQEEDAKILKNELGMNAVRTSHYMQSQDFIDACDKLGLLVFTESPGWQFIGDDYWKKLALKNMERMVMDYRNHPSIILWGARINESGDDHDFYFAANKLIHELDSTRQTGGVRCFKKTEELEDVYTYNDFVPEYENYRFTPKELVTTNPDIPYLISEFNGHMYPTKAFDDEVHTQKHAMNIATCLDALFSDDSRAGAFCWCMFDYNTHKDFGSGDKICYHGVMDMFRNKKAAGYLYSAINGKNTLYLTSSMNHGEYAASNIYKTYLFTDCDSVKMYRNGDLIREYTHKDTDTPNVPNAPILVDDFVGELLITKEGYNKKVSDKMKEVLKGFLLYGENMPLKLKLKYLNLVLFHHISFEKGYQLYGKYIGGWGDKETIYSFEGIKGGKVVNKLTLGDAKSIHLETTVSHTNLHEDKSYDVASIRLRVLDQNNNLAKYYQEGLTVDVEGPIEVIGPKVLSFKGGMWGTYIKTLHKTGKAKLIIKTLFETKEIEFEIK